MPCSLYLVVTDLQIIPAESNGVDAINFRTLRDSKSLDLEKNAHAFLAAGDDIIHAQAGSASVMMGPSTPGMQTPRELVGDTPSSTGGGALPSEGPYEREHNPFGEFSSVTRDIGDW